MKAHSHNVHLGTAEQTGKIELFYFLQRRNIVPQPHVDSQQICGCLNQPLKSALCIEPF